MSNTIFCHQIIKLQFGLTVFYILLTEDVWHAFKSQKFSKNRNPFNYYDKTSILPLLLRFHSRLFRNLGQSKMMSLALCKDILLGLFLCCPLSGKDLQCSSLSLSSPLLQLLQIEILPVAKHVGPCTSRECDVNYTRYPRSRLVAVRSEGECVFETEHWFLSRKWQSGNISSMFVKTPFWNWTSTTVSTTSQHFR